MLFFHLLIKIMEIFEVESHILYLLLNIFRLKKIIE